MLFGHVETLADRVDHLRRNCAKLQDETRGFVGFIPLPYQPENNDIPVQHAAHRLRRPAHHRREPHLPRQLRSHHRLLGGLGLKLAQVALSYGADDLHGTIVEEHIFHMAGAQTPQLTAQTELVKAIREAGREPVQRDTFYEPICVLENACGPAHKPSL
jgi:aminodeoxyfutalosine synthase